MKLIHISHLLIANSLGMRARVLLFGPWLFNNPEIRPVRLFVVTVISDAPIPSVWELKYAVESKPCQALKHLLSLWICATGLEKKSNISWMDTVECSLTLHSIVCDHMIHGIAEVNCNMMLDFLSDALICTADRRERVVDLNRPNWKRRICLNSEAVLWVIRPSHSKSWPSRPHETSSLPSKGRSLRLAVHGPPQCTTLTKFSLSLPPYYYINMGRY